ncbi:PXA domain-containing protein [Scenedesmus sp. NREL 46B-D3]|nr:PXA domain-containing protein [Scenedesmus sp. NREL 46B-D3]
MLFTSAVAGGVAACVTEAAFQLLKLLLCCCLVAGVLDWCSSTAARWVVAVTVVLGLRLLAEQLDARRHLTWPPRLIISSQAAAVATNEQSRDSSAKQQATLSHSRLCRDGDAWRNLVGSEVVATAWDKLCNSIIQEFIYDAWFSRLSPDREFPAEVRWQLNHAFGQASRRAKRLDWTSLLIRDCSAALGSTLQLYRTAADILGPETLRALPAAEADAAIRSVLSKERMLHPAFSTRDGQYQACKRLSEAVLVHIMPPEDSACPMLRALLRELFATCLLRSTLASLAPHSVNKLLLNILDGRTNQRVVSQEVACAAAEFEQKGHHSSRAEQEHMSQQKGEHRSRRSLLRAVNVAQENLARASSVLKSVKRSKSLGDVKDAAGSKSPGRAAAAAISATVWPSGSLAVAKTFSRWKDSPNSSPVRSRASAMQPAGQQGPQALLGSMGAVKAAAQQLSLRRRLGTDARLGVGSVSKAAAVSSSPLPSSVGADSPRSCVRAVELSRSPNLKAGYRIAAAAAAARAMSTGGFTTACGSSEGAGSSMLKSTAIASSSSGSSSSNSMRTPVVAALCGFSKTPWPASVSQSGAADAAAALLVQPHGKLRAQVVSADMLDLDGKDFIVYKVHVADDRGEWTVTRRYRHFEALHKRLKDAPHYKDLPASLPPKRLLTARDTPFVVRRRDELDCYLQALLCSSLLRTHPELLQFLDQQSELYSMAAAADALQGIRPLGAVGVLGQCLCADDAGALNSWRCSGDNSELSQQVGCAGCCSSGAAWQPNQQQPSEQGSGRAGGSSASGSDTGSGRPSAELQAGSRAVIMRSIPLGSHAHLLVDGPVPVDPGTGTWAGLGQMLSTSKRSNDHSSCEHAFIVQQDTPAGSQPSATQQKGHSMAMKPRALQQQSNDAAETTQPMYSSSSSSNVSKSPHPAHATTDSQQDRAAQTPQQTQRLPRQLLQAFDIEDHSCQPCYVLPGSPPGPDMVMPEQSLAVKSATCSRTPGTPRQLSKQASDAAHPAHQAAEPQQWPGSQQLPHEAPSAARSARRSTAVANVHYAPSAAPASRSNSMPVSGSQLGMTAAAAAAAVRKAAANTGDALGNISSNPPAFGVLEAEQPRPATSTAGSTAVDSTLRTGAGVAAAGSIDSVGFEPLKQGLAQAQLRAAKSPARAQAAAVQAAVLQGWQQLQDLQQEAQSTAAVAVSGVHALKVPQQGSSFTCSPSDGVRRHTHAGEQAGIRSALAAASSGGMRLGIGRSVCRTARASSCLCMSWSAARLSCRAMALCGGQ